jgi:TPP-dependent pyruvate/acetoin dehydrogenase alpha subunit
LREGKGPVFLECISQRFAAHSTTARETRTKAALEEIRALCPIQSEMKRLRAAGSMRSGAEEALEKEAQVRVAEALAFADASPYPETSEVMTDVG